MYSLFGDIKNRAKSLGLGENLEFRFLRKETFSVDPKMYAINRDAQLQQELEYIKGGRDVLKGSNWKSRCIYGSTQVSVCRIKSKTKEKLKIKGRCIRNWK